jgi:phosphoserine aminotransferase
MARIFNFSAGPAALPETVLKQAADELLDWRGSGQSVMEMSHRGKEYMAIHAQAEADLRELMAIPANYKVLFLQGGATLQFEMIPMNLFAGKASADFVHTGEWAKKAIKAAKAFGKVNIVASSEDGNFAYAPAQKDWKLDKDAAYVHYTGNETIGGVEFHWTPETGDVPLVCDMSSNILSKPVDVSKYGLIYAGAQKNIGPAGLTIVIIRDDLIGKGVPAPQTMMDYKTHAENDSMYNTPPTYGIYIAGLVFQWLKQQGGLAAIEKQNIAKAKMLYDCIDASRLLRQPGAQGRPLAHERAFHAQGRRARRGIPQGRQGRRHGSAQGPPLGRRHARFDLQRHAGGRRRRTGGLHEGIRGKKWLSRSMS